MIVIFECPRSTRDGNDIRDGIVFILIVGVGIGSIKNFISGIIIGAIVAFDGVRRIGEGFNVERIIVGIGVVFGVLGMTISLVDVRMTYEKCGRARVDQDPCLAIKVEIRAGGRRIG